MFKATLHDADGNEIKAKCYKCNKDADTTLMGLEDTIHYCNECLFGKQPEAKIFYRPNFKKE